MEQCNEKWTSQAKIRCSPSSPPAGHLPSSLSEEYDIFWKRWKGRWTYLYRKPTGRWALFSTHHSAVLDRWKQFSRPQPCWRRKVWYIPRHMFKTGTFYERCRVEDNSTWWIRILTSISYRDFCTDHFLMVARRPETTVSHSLIYVHCRTPEQILKSPRTPNEQIALQYIYVEIQKSLIAFRYANNKRFRLILPDTRLLSHPEQIHQDSPFETLLNAEQAVFNFDSEQQIKFSKLLRALLPGLSDPNISWDPWPFACRCAKKMLMLEVLPGNHFPLLRYRGS